MAIKWQNKMEHLLVYFVQVQKYSHAFSSGVLTRESKDITGEEINITRNMSVGKYRRLMKSGFQLDKSQIKEYLTGREFRNIKD